MRTKRLAAAFLPGIAVAVAAVPPFFGCYSGGPTGGPAPVAAPTPVGVSGAQRLTCREYDNTLADLLGDTSQPACGTLPEDGLDPFDNDYATQDESSVYVQAAESLAGDAADRLVADAARLQTVLPCAPSGPGDADCLRAFVTAFGRRALRRPLTDDEIGAYLSLQSLAVQAQDFDVGVNLAVRAMLQDPSFLYRIEVGRPVDGAPGVFRLNDFEMASRLSYFLWASMPSDALLDMAAGGQLHTPDAIAAAATTMLSDPRALAQVDRFHALWMGYDELPHPPDLTASMRAETRALLERVVFTESRDYMDVFRFDQTYIDPLLARTYGLPLGGASAAWVPYGSSGRAGILSHGSVLSAWGKFGDTSPTQRGKFVRTRLLCQTIPPPPANVDTNKPPDATSSSTCKEARYGAHSQGSCAGCHDLMDPIGFGLERYDTSGSYRTTEPQRPDCPIAGEGRVVGLPAEGGARDVSFNGPGELGAALADSGLIEPCLVIQLFRFAMGRQEQPDDEGTLEALTAAFVANGRNFVQLVVSLVSADAFSLRREGT